MVTEPAGTVVSDASDAVEVVVFYLDCHVLLPRSAASCLCCPCRAAWLQQGCNRAEQISNMIATGLQQSCNMVAA